MNVDIFKKEMQKLEQACNHTLPSAAIKLWYDDLKDEGFNSEDFKKGVTDTRRSCGRYFPTLSDLIEKCRPYYTARMEKEGYLQKNKDDETAKRFFEGKRYTENSQVGTDLVNGLFAGTTSKAEAVKKMREMEGKHPGKGWGEQADILEAGE